MTDKQIIFDDVDVKDCIAYAKSQEIYLGNTLYKQMEKVCMVKNQPCEFFDCQFKQMARELKAKEQECERLKTDKIFLEAHINDLTSPVNVEDCEHSVHNGEYIACSYYGGCRCDDLDFANCMFRENVRLKEQLDQLKAENDELKGIRDMNFLHALEEQEKANKLKQTLTEIKEIANDFYLDGEHCKVESLALEILRKISEVEE